MQGEDKETVTAFTHVGSTLAEDGDVYAEITHRVQ